MIGCDDDRRIIVHIKLLHAAQVIVDDIKRPFRLCIDIGVVEPHVFRHLVHTERLMRADEMDEAERTARIALLDRETEALQPLEVLCVVHKVRRLGRIGFGVVRHHGQVDFIGVEPKGRLEQPRHIAVERALRKSEPRAHEVHRRGVGCMQIHRATRDVACIFTRKVFQIQRVGIQTN